MCPANPTGPVQDKAAFLGSAKALKQLGISLYATRGTAEFLGSNDISTTVLHWPLEDAVPNVLDYFSRGKIDLVINVPKNHQREELTNDYLIRRRAVDFGVPLITNISNSPHRYAEGYYGRKVVY